ncbi:MAG TPA: energy transducer TonB [Lysobacter sp.]
MLVVLLAVCGWARADVADVARQAELSLVATGWVEVDTGGGVAAYGLDKPEQLPIAVTELAARKIPQWTFAPPATVGENGRMRAKMSVRFAAKALAGGQYALRIAGSSFNTLELDEMPRLQAQPRAPRFPAMAAKAGVSGTVFVVFRITRDGVVEPAVEQVNLRLLSDEALLAAFRELFTEASLEAARDWKFRPPERGPEKDQQAWYVRVPIEFVRIGRKPYGYGEWQAYVPGPRMHLPWSEAGAQDTVTAPDATPDGGMQPLKEPLRLLATPDDAQA